MQTRASQSRLSLASGLCTVVIPVFNRPHELREAIRSVLAQTYREIEIIVVDDGSEPRINPASYEMASKAAGIPLKWVALPENRGPSAARNRGLQAACGEFVTFLDSDDVMLPEKLFEQLRILSEDKTASAVICGYMTSSASSAGNGECHDHLPDGDITIERLLSFDRSLRVTGSSVFRDATVRAVNGFDPLLHAVEDFDLLVRIVANGGKVRTLRKALLHVDVSPLRSHLSEDFKKQEIGRMRFLQKHGELLKLVSPKARTANLLCLGIVRFRSGARRRAATDFLRVIRLNPFQPKAWTYLLCCAAPSLYPSIVRAAKAAQAYPESSRTPSPVPDQHHANTRI